MTTTKPYDPSLLLTDDTLIAGAIEDALNDPDPRVLPVVLSDVAKIKGLSVADLAEGAQLNRDSLYKTFKGNTDVKWATVGGYHWTIVPMDRRNDCISAPESASVGQDIAPFATFLAGLVQDQLDAKANPGVPAA